MSSKLWSWVLVVGVLSIASTLLLLVAPAHAAETTRAASALDPAVLRWAYLAAASATSVSSVAAAFAVARVGSAAVGALAEKPELFGRVLVLVGLAEGIAIYGLIVSILILNHLG